jgi:hypothetical protein
VFNLAGTDGTSCLQQQVNAKITTALGIVRGNTFDLLEMLEWFSLQSKPLLEATRVVQENYIT